MHRGLSARTFVVDHITSEVIACVLGLTPTEEPRVERVIRSGPATVVIGSDGRKAVVRREDGDEDEPMLGLMLAIARWMGHNEPYGHRYKLVRRLSRLSRDEMRWVVDLLNHTLQAEGESDG